MLTHARLSPLDRISSLNRALDQALTSTWPTERPWVPAVDIVETKDAFMVYADLPGVQASEIDMSFEKSVLTIRGSRRSVFAHEKGTELRVYAAERPAGTFERSMRLPDFVDSSRIAADLTNGVLTVTVPKAEAAQPRQIEIGTGNRTQTQLQN